MSSDETEVDNSTASEPSSESSSEPSSEPSRGLPSSSRGGSGDRDRLDRLYDMLGGDDDKIDTSTVDQVDQRDINRLTPQGRALMRRQRALARERERKLKNDLQAEREARASERSDLEQQRLNLQRSRENYAKMFGSKKMREQIERGLAVDPSKVDYTSATGIQQLIDHKVAQQFNAFAEPALKEAETMRREEQIRQLHEEYPQMNDPTFRMKVNKHLKMRRDRGENISGKIREAILQVDYEDRQQKNAAAREQRRKRARESAQHTAKNTNTATKQVRGEIPKDVVRKGGAAIARWLRNNPKEAQAVLAAARRR